MAPRLRHLLLTTTENPDDQKAWSGIPYSLRTALEGCVEQLTVLPLTRPRRTPLASLRRLLFGAVRYPLWISKPALRAHARQVRQAIATSRPDAVLSISSQALLLLERPAVPLFLFSDAPYMTFAETYARWEKYPDRLPQFAAEEAALAARLSGICYGSAWACHEAARQFSLSAADAERKLHVTPLGANFQPAGGAAEVAEHIARRDPHTLQLLFVGRDWERKGGPLTVETARQMHAQGQPVHLHIVGCRPEVQEPFVTIHGLLSRDKPAERRKLEQLYLNSHFLMTPTLAECFGIVFAEAQAFGLPPVSRAVDAVPSIVLDDETGLLFATDAPAAEYVARLRTLFAEPERYRAMAYAARQRFEQTLTWESCAKNIVAAMETTLAKGVR